MHVSSADPPVPAGHVRRWGYLNTSSSAGSPRPYDIPIASIGYMTRWVNYLGNPSYGIHLNDPWQAIDAATGEEVYMRTLLCIDDYGCENNLGRVTRIQVDKRKRLV